MSRTRKPVLLLPPVLVLGALALPAHGVDPSVRDAEARRIAVIEKIKPAVVAVFSPGSQGGGSGVLVSPDGYALTNFHVVAGAMPTMECGLPDGNLYHGVIVGIDRVGDVALIKLLPEKEGQPFPAAVLGDSDKVKAGDWSLALGNPFLLATDFTPTVTYGLVSGVHRYQYPEAQRGTLEYTDCIQVDTSINPGNSGGPLFNLAGELVGINGRISLQKRERINSGVGYAISINQIKNFLGHLRAGLECDHASTGFRVESDADDGANPRMVIRSILENCDAHRRGLEPDDELVSFAGRPMTSVNQYKNVLGVFPKGWRVPLVYRRNNEKHEVLVRLMGVLRSEAEEGPPRRRPGAERPPTPAPESPAKKLYEARPGFANYYFNKLERDRLWAAFRKHGDFSGLTGDWTIEGQMETRHQKEAVKVSIVEEKDKEGKAGRTLVRLALGSIKYELDPLRSAQDATNLKDPPGSGGLLAALYQYRRLLTLGDKGFEGQFGHGGQEPFYPLPADGSPPKSFQDMRVDTEVLNTEHAAVPVKWHFSLKDQTLLGFEVTTDANEDPCEVYLSDYRPVEGRSLPHRLEVRYGNGRYGVLTVQSYHPGAAN